MVHLKLSSYFAIHIVLIILGLFSFLLVSNCCRLSKAFQCSASAAVESFGNMKCDADGVIYEMTHLNGLEIRRFRGCNPAINDFLGSPLKTLNLQLIRFFNFRTFSGINFSSHFPS